MVVSIHAWSASQWWLARCGCWVRPLVTVHTASVVHTGSTHADRMSWQPAPANHHCDTLQAGVKPPFWYTIPPWRAKQGRRRREAGVNYGRTTRTRWPPALPNGLHTSDTTETTPVPTPLSLLGRDRRGSHCSSPATQFRTTKYRLIFCVNQMCSTYTAISIQFPELRHAIDELFTHS